MSGATIASLEMLLTFSVVGFLAWDLWKMKRDKKK